MKDRILMVYMTDLREAYLCLRFIAAAAAATAEDIFAEMASENAITDTMFIEVNVLAFPVGN